MNEPTFGVINLQAVTAVNKDTRLVSLSDIAVTSGRFPAAADSSQYLAAVTLVLPASARDISLDRLQLSVATSQEQQKAKAVPVKNDPPRILFSAQQSLLVLINGEPKLVPITGQPVSRIVNTTAFVAQDQAGQHWLHVYDGFRTATALAGPWTVGTKVPSAVNKAAQAAAKSLF